LPSYRRNRVLGGTFFFTVTCSTAVSDLFVTKIDISRDAIRPGCAPAQPFASSPVSSFSITFCAF
jgi:hypothetical protein